MKRFPSSTPQPSRPGRPLRAWHYAALVGIVVYCVVFYNWNEMRRLRLGWMVIPDTLVAEWVGGETARFGVADRLPLLLAGGVILLCGALAGALALLALRLGSSMTRLERLLASLAVGLNLWSTATLAIGLAGGLQQRSWFAALAAALLVGAVLRYNALRDWFGKRADEAISHSATARHTAGKDEPSGLARLASWLCLPFAVVILLGSLLPPWHFDVREYHAQVPKEWYQQGHIDFLPHNVYGNMPLGAEMHLLLGMQLVEGQDVWWWGTLVGKLVIGSFALLTAAAVYAVGRRLAGRTAGAVAAYLFLSTPWVPYLSMAGLIDVVSAFYLLLTLWALLQWWEQPAGTGWQWAALAGYLAGAAVAVKYPAVLFVAVPGGLAIAMRSLVTRQLAWQAALAYALACGAGCGLWLAKNYVLSGNPTYPLLYSLFDGRTRTPAKDQQWSQAHRPPEDGFTWRHLRISSELLLIGSEYASPLLVPFAVLGVLAWPQRRTLLVLLGGVVFVVITWWLLTHRVDRFLVPILPLVALLAGRAADLSSTRLWRRTIGVLLVAALMPNLTLATSRSIGDNRLLASLGSIKEVDLATWHPSDPRWHPAQLYLNQAVQPGYRALLCGEAQVFDLAIPILYNTCFDDCLFEQIFAGRSRAERYQRLRELRISHILISWHELDRYRSPGNYGYSPYTTRELVRDELAGRQGLLRRVPLGLHEDNAEVYEVVGWQDW